MRRGVFGAMVTVAMLASLVAAQSAPAAISDSEELTRVGSGGGSGAGELRMAQVSAGIASDPVTGHFYAVEESPNYRVSEFTPWGKFVKAFGWDVAPGAVNERQEVRIRAQAGQFKLSFEGQQTTDLQFNASAAEVEAALSALPAIGAGGVSVEEVPGTAIGTTPFIHVITFKGSLAGTNVSPLLAVNGATPLSGGVPSDADALVARVSAEGTAGGVGFEHCTEESGCKSGLFGGGSGQFGSARGATIDAAGNLYVREIDNLRVQKFDPGGHFLLMFGGDVNKTKVEAAAPPAQRNRCPVDPGDVCQAASPGTGDGQFADSFASGIAICDGTLFVADKDRIQRFNPQGEFAASVPVPGKVVQALACDPIGDDLYATFQSEPDVHRLDPTTGEEVSGIEVEGSRALATNAAGELFIATGTIGVLEFDTAAKPLSPPSCCAPPASMETVGLGTNAAGDLHVAQQGGVENFIRILGPAPVIFEAPPPVPPTISAQFASSVLRDGATVAADINPHFFIDAHYFVQYGVGKCSEGACVNQVPLDPASLTTKVTSSVVRTAGVFLEGLAPGTTYHYRFVAQSSGGGPVEGAEASFNTYPEPTPIKACANDVLRIGPAARLPNCRAYEMVSPVDKGNGDIKALLDTLNYNTALSQSASDGGRFTYSSFRSFGDPKGAPYTSQYLATRDPVSGWTSEALDAAQTSHSLGSDTFGNPYKAFSADLCRSWLIVDAEPTLAPGAPADYRTLYGRRGCGPLGYEALIPVAPPSKAAFYPILQGTSADGQAAVFAAEDKLTDEGTSGTSQAYHASAGQLRLICFGVNGLPTSGSCSVGTGPVLIAGDTLILSQQERFALLTHAISADGTKVYWTATGATKSGPGKVYLRENPGAAQSAVNGSEECTEADKACTVAVSETVTPEPARFWRASADGAKALFEITQGSSADKLFKFEAGSGSTQIAGKVIGVAGASEDLSRVYFISEEVLAGTSGASAGKPNLYLDEEGTKTFIATIAAIDAVGRVPSNAPSETLFQAARATPDGRALAFLSTERLTGYDNSDLTSGKADSQVYIYEVGAAGPICVSCNPSGARPLGRAVEGAGGSGQFLPTAGSLTTPENDLYAPRGLSADGQRLLFNSFDALLLRDTNGKGDVYEWERASGPAECAQKGAELYVAAAAGCISLISTGESPEDSELLDASADASDAFFTTNASLLPRDPGLFDVYDARVGGGFPEPTPPPARCQGETCQPAVAPPNDPTPSSSSYEGPEDEKQKAKKKKKKKQKHKNKKKAKAKKQGNQKRGARR